MGTMKYDTWEDVRLRLNRTICLYRGHPYYVYNEGIDPPSRDVFLRELGENQFINRKKDMRVPHDDPDFDPRSPELGYCFFNGEALYLSRVPDRRQRQGLSVESLRVEPRNVGPGTVFLTKAMEDCILGRHKTLHEALDLIDSGDNSVPIHRHFAVGRIQNNHMLGLFYRCRLIGTKDDYADRFTLLPSRDHSYLMKITGKMGLT